MAAARPLAVSSSAPVVSVVRDDSVWTLTGPEQAHSRSATIGDEVFAGWHTDGRRLIVEHDRYGVHPFFYTATRESIQLSTSIDSLLASGVASAVDDSAMAVFLRTGFFVGDDTPFAAIRAIPPAAALVWGPGGPSVRSRWTPPAASRLTRVAAVSAFGDVFASAMARRLADSRRPVAVLLSGGHDSRHILLAMHELKQLPDHAVTVEPYPPAAPEDVAVARAVASAVGVRHTVLPHHPRRVAAERAKNRLTHYCADEHAEFLPLRAFFEREPCTVFDGVGGDVLSQNQKLDGSLHRLFTSGRFDLVAERVLGDAATVEPALARLLTPQAQARYSRARAIARVASEAARYANAPNPIGAFFFFTRMRRAVALAPYGVLDATAVHTPFLDRDVVDFLLSLPYDLVADRRLHAAVLHKRYPEFAHLPFAGTLQGKDDRRLVQRDAIDLARLAVVERSPSLRARMVVMRALRAFRSGRSAELSLLPRIVHLLDVAQCGADGPRRARK